MWPGRRGLKDPKSVGSARAAALPLKTAPLHHEDAIAAGVGPAKAVIN